MARRYSGNVRIEVTYVDGSRYGVYFERDHYTCKLTWPGGSKTITVHPPVVGFGRGIAYDSPRAYDRTAEAAVTFVGDESRDLPGDFEPDWSDAGALISRRKG